MIGVSEAFTIATEKSSRKVVGKVEVDWDLDGTFLDESDYTSVIEIERKLNEPFGGISISLADVVLLNNTDRYTPPGSTV
jgi:hypothetical protein